EYQRRISFEMRSPVMGGTLRPSSATMNAVVSTEPVKPADGEKLFRDAELALGRKDLAMAEHFCRKALEAVPDDPRYGALLAWVEVMLLDPKEPAEIAALIARLDTIIRNDASCYRAFFCRGLLRKRTGDDEHAFRDFRRVIALDPHNVE